MKIQEVTDLREFKSLRGTWNNLLAKSGDKNIFLTWEWLFTWWEYYGIGKGLRILKVEDDNELVGIIPLVSSTYFLNNFQIIENMGIGLSDYGGFIYSSENNKAKEMLGLIASYFENNKLLVHLDQIPGDSEIYNLLKNHNSSKLIINKNNSCDSLYLPVPESWEDYQNLLSRNFRKNLLRNERIIEKNIGSIELKIYSKPESIENNLSQFWNLHQKKMNHKKLPNFDKHKKMFFNEVVKKFASNDWLNLSFLLINGNPVSGVLGFEYDKRYCTYQSAYDIDYKYSLGHIHYAYIIKNLINRNLKEFDFLRGKEPYKFLFRPVIRNNIEVFISKKNILNYYKLKIMPSIIHLNEIRKRSFNENYQYYLEKKKIEKVLSNYQMCRK